MKEVDTDELPPEERHELEAAFGEGTDVIELEASDLKPMETPTYEMADLVEEGDWVTVQHKAGNVTTGPVTEVSDTHMEVDPRNRTASGYFSFRDFEDGRGVQNELIDVNGQKP